MDLVFDGCFPSGSGGGAAVPKLSPHPIKIEEVDDSFPSTSSSAGGPARHSLSFDSCESTFALLRTSSFDCSLLDDLPMPEDEDVKPLVQSANVFSSSMPLMEPTICVVCGDRASGFHYSVVSCNGCKTFFRRTVISRRKFKCTRGGMCVFDKARRCACRACRFQKCLQVGMNPKNIQIFYTGVRKGRSEEFQIKKEEEEEINLPTPSPEISLCSSVLTLSATLKDLSLRESRLDALRVTSPKTAYYVNCGIEDLLLTKSLFADFSGTPSKQVVPKLAKQCYETEPIKFWIISELALAVEYAKSFLVFNELPKEDQWMLAAHSLSVLAILTFAFDTVEKNRETTYFPDGKDAYDYMNKSGTSTMFDAIFNRLHRKPSAILRPLAASRTHLALLRAIHLFNPDVPGLSASTVQIVRAERERYTTVLSKLVFSEGGNAPTRLQDLLFAIPAFFSTLAQCNDHVQICSLMGFELHPLNRDSILGMRGIRLKDYCPAKQPQQSSCDSSPIDFNPLTDQTLLSL